jgi:hypothetical protein
MAVWPIKRRRSGAGNCLLDPARRSSQLETSLAVSDGAPVE